MIEKNIKILGVTGGGLSGLHKILNSNFFDKLQIFLQLYKCFFVARATKNSKCLLLIPLKYTNFNRKKKFNFSSF